MNQTTIEVDAIPTLQRREGHYTLVAESNSHRYILRIPHGQLEGKALDALVASRLKAIMAQAGEDTRRVLEFCNRQLGRMNNQTLDGFGASVEVEAVVPPPAA